MIEAAVKKAPGIADKLLPVALALTMIRAIIAALLGGIVLSVGIEWAGMLFDWWLQPGAGHAREMLIAELRWTQLIHYFWDPDRVLSQMRETTNPMIAAVAGLAIYDYLLALYYVSQTTVVRIIVIISALPAVLLLWALSLLDGLVARDLRKHRVLHESSYLYHNAKALFAASILVPPLIYLSLPFSFHPTAFLLLFTTPAGAVIWLMASRFKKYL